MKKSFIDFCYLLYITDWLRRIPVDEQLESYRQWYDNDLDPLDYNFNGQMYVCEDEFCDCEFQDEEYMRTLLNDEEYETYLKLIK